MFAVRLFGLVVASGECMSVTNIGGMKTRLEHAIEHEELRPARAPKIARAKSPSAKLEPRSQPVERPASNDRPRSATPKPALPDDSIRIPRRDSSSARSHEDLARALTKLGEQHREHADRNLGDDRTPYRPDPRSAQPAPPSPYRPSEEGPSRIELEGRSLLGEGR